MSQTENDTINNLFRQMDAEASYLKQLELDAVRFGPFHSIHSQVEWWMAKLAITQKRLVRAFLKSGGIGELICHIRAGTLPPYSIQGVCGRL